MLTRWLYLIPPIFYSSKHIFCHLPVGILIETEKEPTREVKAPEEKQKQFRKDNVGSAGTRRGGCQGKSANSVKLISVLEERGKV